jgi:hypothetical protein
LYRKVAIQGKLWKRAVMPVKEGFPKGNASKSCDPKARENET